jgi:hypothetical protein
MLAGSVVGTAATSAGRQKRPVFAKRPRATGKKRLDFAKTPRRIVVSRCLLEDAAEKFGGGMVVWGGWMVSRRGAMAKREHRGVAKHCHEVARKSLHLFVASNGLLSTGTVF